MRRYFLWDGDESTATEVSEAAYIRAERRAGFIPNGPGPVATHSFSVITEAMGGGLRSGGYARWEPGE